MESVSKSEEETYQLAAGLAAKLRGGDILALSGDLGSGKTTFTKGIAQALGLDRPVTSPTFVLMKEYKLNDKCQMTNVRARGTRYLVHVDAYRMRSASEAESIGLAEFFVRDDAITVIEWPEKIIEILPSRTRWIEFGYINDNTRRITF